MNTHAASEINFMRGGDGRNWRPAKPRRVGIGPARTTRRQPRRRHLWRLVACPLQRRAGDTSWSTRAVFFYKVPQGTRVIKAANRG
ncbi:hypothetical protein COCOBI_17-1720 [Coccomyxa sp. Obi]|nr:hypothetical protein COCOBI_17-1720 [Coccomyxa sp. Obi]